MQRPVYRIQHFHFRIVITFEMGLNLQSRTFIGLLLTQTSFSNEQLSISYERDDVFLIKYVILEYLLLHCLLANFFCLVLYDDPTLDSQP